MKESLRSHAIIGTVELIGCTVPLFAFGMALGEPHLLLLSAYMFGKGMRHLAMGEDLEAGVFYGKEMKFRRKPPVQKFLAYTVGMRPLPIRRWVLG